jgi:hypothetical protein
MSTHTKRSTLKKATLVTASAVGVAVVAAAPVAGAADPDLTNTTNNCTAKIEAGFHPPAILNNGFTIETAGRGGCDTGTTFQIGIVELQKLDAQGNWDTFASTTFTSNPPGQYFPVIASGPGNGGRCEVVRARTRVWRRADAGQFPNSGATAAVSSEGVTVGSQNISQFGVCKV